MSDMTSAYLLIAVIFAVLVTLLLVRIGVFKSRKAAISNGVRASGNMANSLTSTSAPSPEMKYCMKCGKQMPSEMNFCGHCGKEQLPTLKSDSSGRAAANVPTKTKSSDVAGGLLAIVVVIAVLYLVVTIFSWIFDGVTSAFDGQSGTEWFRQYHMYVIGAIAIIGYWWRKLRGR